MYRTSARDCDRTGGSFTATKATNKAYIYGVLLKISLSQSELTREQLSLPLASPPRPRLPLLHASGSRGIQWAVQSIDLWLVSQPPHSEGAMKYSDRQLAGLSARPPDRAELIGRRGLSLSATTGPSYVRSFG